MRWEPTDAGTPPVINDSNNGDDKLRQSIGFQQCPNYNVIDQGLKATLGKQHTPVRKKAGLQKWLPS